MPAGSHTPTPAWLHDAAAHRADGDGHVLLDERGELVARLVRGEVPTVPPTVSESAAQPPEVSEKARRGLQQAVPLPDGVTAADTETLLGRWTSLDAPADSEAHARFDPDDATGQQRRRLRFRTPDPNRPLVVDHRGRSPLHTGELTDGMTPGVVEGEQLRVFVTRPEGQELPHTFVADAQHLDGEGLWWCPDEEVFLAPTHGELFDPAGRLVAGPARADLDRLPLQTTDDGLLVADTDQREPGTPRDTGLGLKADINPSVYDRYRHDWGTPGSRTFCADHQPPIQRPDINL